MGDSLIRDQIVLGINDEGMTKRLSQQRNLSLLQCSVICNSEYSTTYPYRQMKLATAAELCAVSRDKTKKTTNAREICKFCAMRYPNTREQCPALGRKCTRCGKRNHFARCCQSADVSALVHDKSRTDAEYTIGNVFRRAKIVYATLSVEGRAVRFQLDT